MTTKANRTRSAAKQAEKKMAMTFAESPWALVAALAALVAVVVVLIL